MDNGRIGWREWPTGSLGPRDRPRGPKLCDKCTQKIVNIIIDIVAEEEGEGGEGKRENDEHFINKIKS